MDASKRKTWQIDVQARWFKELQAGNKTIEGKRDSRTWSGMKVGDRIVFESDGKTFEMYVFAIRRYKTLLRYLAIEGLGRTLPGVLTIEEGIAQYLEYWTEEEIRRDGILAIEVDFL
jgi:ASC-1-like (ASCH) protein